MRDYRPTPPDYSRLRVLDRFIATLFTHTYGRRSSNPQLRRRLPACAGNLRGRPLRMFICLAIILNLVIWPSPDVTIRPVLEPMSVVASTVTSTASNAGLTLASALSEFRDAPPVVLIKIGTVIMPVPVFPLWFQSSTPRELTMEERTARAVNLTLAPHRFVGYIGDTVTFVARGTTVDGQPAHGAKFSFESSDESKMTIDEAGRATLLAAGMVIVTAQAGAAIKTAPVLIRSTRRRVQTDAEWRADQDSLVGSTDRESGESGTGSLLGAIGDRLMPTAYAQGGGQGVDYGNAAPIGQVGTPPFAALEETRLGPVMPQTNFELPISLVDLGGRGLATSLMAYYNSNSWGAYVDGSFATHYVFDPIQSWPSPGFSLGYGRIVIYNGYYDPGLGDTVYTFMLVDANGTRHFLGTGTSSGANTLQTTDGSHITFVGNALGGTVYYQDGTKMTIGLVNNRRLATQVTDSNGNFIQIAYKWETNYPGIAINYIVDTLGRVISFNYGEWPAPPGSTLLTSISTPAGSVTFGYQTVTMNYNFLTEPIVDNAPASFSAVSSVTAPGRPTYNLSYSGYGMAYAVSAVSGGGTATVTYNYPLGGEQIIGGPTFTQRTESGSPNAVYTYDSFGTITRPDGTKLTVGAGGSRTLKNSSNQVLSSIGVALTTDPGGSTAVQSITTTDEIGQQTKVDFDYDGYGNVLNKREYGFKISGQWQVRRRTHYSYINWEPYLSAYIRNRAWMVEVFDSLQNTNNGDDVLIGKTVVSYDNPMGGMEGYGGTANPPGHLSGYNTTYTTRGNLTGVTKYPDLGGAGVGQGSKTDIFGGTTKAQVSCCDEKSFTMTEATYWSRASQTITGNTSGIYLTTNAAYDFNTLTTTSETDPNSQTTTYNYDLAQRPTGFILPTGASTSTSFSVWGDLISASVNYSESGQNTTLTSTAVYDGWGQVTQSVDVYNAQINYTYDNMGQELTRTNPFPQGGTPGAVSTYQYDLLGRNTLVTLPGGNTVQTNYDSSMVTVTDQVNRKVKSETDGLGRLIKVTEQDVSTGELTQETTYTYDLADHLTLVNQGNQTRAFKYDAEGHLLFERIPEMSATINDGTGTYWSTKYTYADWGAVATKQDARGVIMTYVYDTLHRLTSISYNTSGAPGVAATPNVTYTYDNSQSSGTKGLLLSVSAGSGYSESYGYDSFKRMQSVTRTIDGHNYTTGYQFNTANQATQMTYPSGRVINLGHDNKGRLTSVGSFLNGVTYNGIGQLTGTSLGNGVSETYGYDANRMKLTSQTATKSGGPTNGLVNLSYGYDALAGQMGAGSTAGNAGQLMTIGGTIGGVAESAAYTYDNLGRLSTSNQSSNGSSAQRRFAFDRWGNSTGVWDATSGGNQIQTITLEQSGAVPTNRIQSVNPGVPTNTNVALAANGATATASSTYSGSYPDAAVIDGDRKAKSWGDGAGWMDGTSNTYPDWIQVDFNGSKTINEIDVFTLQDNYEDALEPTENMTFSLYGIVDFQVQYWNGSGWVTVAGGSVTGNNKVWKKITFSQITTSKIRVNVTNALSNYSRVTEVEAWGMIAGNSSYSYDAAGNVTNDGAHSYTYDGENRIVSVDGGATGQYGYDLSNQRYKKVTGGATTHYIWQDSEVIAQHNGSTGAVLVDYVYSDDRMIAKVESGTTQYFLSDRLSIRQTLNVNGDVVGRQAHLPLGEDFAESGTQEKQHFTSYERDSESGTDYAINRQYAQTVGRFLQIDPAGCKNRNPQTLNRYSYVHNDPVNFSDPDGRVARQVGKVRGIEIKLVNADGDTDQDPASEFTPMQRRRKKPKPPVPPPSPPRLTRIVVTASSFVAVPVTVQAYGHRDTPQELAHYRGELTAISSFGGAILFNGSVRAFGTAGGLIPWTHCLSCLQCINPVNCSQNFHPPEFVRVIWDIVYVPVPG
jgi:RHS repeat-associated protein